MIACMMMLKSLKVMMLLGVLMMGFKAQSEEMVETIKKDFELLCDFAGATMEFLSTVTGSPDDFHEDDEKKLSQTVHEIFFGEKGDAKGIWKLPTRFTEKKPNRSAVCGSTQPSNSEGMPSALDSMASTFLCLCTPTGKIRKGFCGVDVETSGNWPVNEISSANVDRVFVEVWGEGYDHRVMNKCGSSGKSEDFEDSMRSLTESMEKLESLLEEKSGTLGENSTTCQGVQCALVGKRPTWLKKLEEIKKIKKIVKPIKVINVPQQEISATAPKITTEPTSTSGPEHAPTSKNENIDHKVHEEPPKKEPRKASSPEPVTEPEKPAEMPPKLTEDLSVGGANETSENSIKGPKCLLPAALLI
ncbi:Variant surface glycoprotein [Trypanosoma congolense IL3000]|uniref:Variant surface glycoprotein n=1 Tax=Trypanosoma congolense (strain IL3000) TaxID=1068625 RepID=F9W7Y9_TRYCI|nr:Variant surface glycoprotein [Trypanosoma congolense IL3000]